MGLDAFIGDMLKSSSLPSKHDEEEAGIEQIREGWVTVRVVKVPADAPEFRVAVPKGELVLRKEDVLTMKEELARALMKAGLVEILRNC